MKILGILTVLLVVLVVGGFALVAGSDVSIQQTTVTRDLPTDNLK